MGGRSSTRSGARVVAATVVGRAKELGTKTLCWEVPHHVGDAHVAGLVEGTLLAAYTYTEFKEPEKDGIEALILSAHHDVGAAASGRGDGDRGGQPRARPAELAGERADAERAGRARRGSWRA